VYFLPFNKYSIKPVHAVTSIKQSLECKGNLHLSCHRKFHMDLTFLSGHLSYKATSSFPQRWPLNTGLTGLQTLLCIYLLLLWRIVYTIILKKYHPVRTGPKFFAFSKTQDIRIFHTSSRRLEQIFMLTNCCFSERTSLLFHWTLTFSRQYIPEKLLSWR